MGFVFLRSHPYASQRIKMLEKEIPSIKERASNKIAQVGSPATAKTAEDAKEAKDSPQSRPLKVMCPKCKRIFSGNTNYCPYDGARLE